MPKDYKSINKKAKSPSSIMSKFLPMLTKICIGLFISFFFFQYIKDNSLNTKARESAPTPTEQEELKVQVSELKFDFYKILPNREVNISEWIAEDLTKDKPALNKTYLYVLQVGSFKESSTADQTKAQLASIDIKADIQHVVINGRGPHYRVRVGPYAGLSELAAIESRLRDNKFEFMKLRLKLEELQSSQ